MEPLHSQIQKMLKTAEFAKLCKTSKDTLIFYDRIGVFKPAYVDGKRYRYYEPQQAIRFAFISQLRDIGFSLEEIKAFIASGDETAFLEALKNKTEDFRAAIQAARRQLYFAGRILELSRKLQHKEPNTIRIQTMRERRFLFRGLGMPKPIQTLKDYSECLYESEDCGSMILPIGYAARTREAAEGRLFFNGLLDYAESGKTKNILRLPAGLYAVWSFRGDTREHEVGIQTNLQTLEKKLSAEREFFHL